LETQFCLRRTKPTLRSGLCTFRPQHFEPRRRFSTLISIEIFHPIRFLFAKSTQKIVLSTFSGKQFDPFFRPVRSLNLSFVFPGCRLLHSSPLISIQASYYLDIKSLVNLTSRAIATQVSGKTTEELRETLYSIGADIYSPVGCTPLFQLISDVIFSHVFAHESVRSHDVLIL
jgi:hypothetical protein